MGVALLLRAVVAVGLGAHRVLRWAEGPGADNLTSIPRSLWDRMSDPLESESDLTTALGLHTGTLSEVALYPAPFETRKLQLVWDFGYAGSPGEDVRVCTFHFLKLVAGSPNATWTEPNFTAIEDAIDTWWLTLKGNYTSAITLTEGRWYKAGPAIVPPQEPVRVVDFNSAGTLSGGAYVQLPPQVAISVTEKTSARRQWGRFYLPAPVHSVLTAASGRIATAILTSIADLTEELYTAANVANTPVVVYSPTNSTALTVDQIQVDDIPDVIRSRRFDQPLLKVQRAIP